MRVYHGNGYLLWVLSIEQRAFRDSGGEELCISPMRYIVTSDGSY